MKRFRKGELQIDYVIAMGIFIVMFAFLLYYITNYVSFSTQPKNEITQKGIQAQQILFESEGLPKNWEKTNNTVRVGLVKTLYRVPLYVYSNSTRSNWPIESIVNFGGIPTRASVSVTDVNNSIIQSQVQNVSEPVDTAAIYFVTNLTQGRNVFYVYYSDQNVTASNATGLNESSSSFGSDCVRKINSTILTFHLCKGKSDGNGTGIRSLISTAQGFEVADVGSIDEPFLGGDYFVGNETFNSTTFEEGNVFAKYRLSAVNENTTFLVNYSFYNGTPIWKIDLSVNTTNAQNTTKIRNNVKDLFDKYQNHNTTQLSIPNTQIVNRTNYTLAINSSTNYVFATGIISTNNIEVAWNKTIEPEIRTSDTPSLTTITLWHSYGIGNNSTAYDLFNTINVTTLSSEIIKSIGFEKLTSLQNKTYDVARSSLDMGQDNFFITITNSTSIIFSYGTTQKKRDVYVESGKTLMQKQDGTIDYVTYTLGVWR